MPSDMVLHKGRMPRLHSSPLESLWNEARPRPRFLFPEVFPRGYNAIWVLRGGKLYLLGLNGWTEEGHVAGALFPDGGPTVHALWYSGSRESSWDLV
jgi:hypothetical protein